MLRRIRRLSLLPVVLTALVLTGATDARAVSTPGTGTHDGWFHPLSRDQGSVDLQLRPGGGYSVTWGQVGSFIAGTGWQPGGPRTLTYSAVFQPQGNSYLAVYGWTRNPLTEYYVIESWGTYRPTGTVLGTVTTDGGVYDLYRIRRNPPPSINGSPWYQYLSVRQSRRTSGRITLANHFDAWARAGMPLGAHVYTILATEASEPGRQLQGHHLLRPGARAGPGESGPDRVERAVVGSEPGAAARTFARVSRSAVTRRKPGWAVRAAALGDPEGDPRPPGRFGAP